MVECQPEMCVVLGFEPVFEIKKIMYKLFYLQVTALLVLTFISRIHG